MKGETADKLHTLAVRDAIFQVADGRPLEPVMSGIIMAMARIVTNACDGDGVNATAILQHFHDSMMAAIPLYCVEAKAGQRVPS